VCFVLDFVAFSRQIRAYKRGVNGAWNDAFADVSLLVLASVFVFIDGFYFAWIFSTVLKFPKELGRYIIQGLCGHFDGVKKQLRTTLSRITNRQ